METANHQTEHKLQLRNLTTADYKDVKEIISIAQKLPVYGVRAKHGSECLNL
ncbi:MAG: hypothetical protein R6U97_00330 [Desulfosalsimonas sp.]